MQDKTNKIIIDLEPISRRLYFSQEKTIYQFLIDSGIQIRTLCGGIGQCGKCGLQIRKGIEFLNMPSPSEIKLLGNRKITENWRLACQTKIKPEKLELLNKASIPQLVIYLPDELLFEDFKILTDGAKAETRVLPNIKKMHIKIEKPTLEKPISDLERILAVIKLLSNHQRDKIEYDVELDVLKQFPELMQDDINELTVTLLDSSRIIKCEAGNQVEYNYGIAFDIGTTTVVGYLINLNNGKTHGVASMLNPQTAFGEDVVTRITYIKNNKDGLKRLNKVIIEALNKLIEKLCSKSKIHPYQICEVSIVGNSVMHHIFLGLNPISIGLSPYVPVVQQGLNNSPQKLNLNIYDHGNVYTLPLISGFVGADTMGVIISSKIDKESKLTLALDIGTNGEIVIGNKDFLVTGSCAAGSALEGAHIKNGMRAAGGAIDKVEIDEETLDISFTTIKNKKPIGICGSGLIDAVAELLKSKLLTRSGMFNKDMRNNERFVTKDKNLEFIIAKKDETAIGRDVTISQKDIREIQMAKAAFYSGTRIIMDFLRKKYSLEAGIEQIFLAGAFGNYISKESAKFIGMIPDIDSNEIFQIGNAAGIGAINCLLNKKLRSEAHHLLKKIDYVEIAIEPKFQREYAEAMYFPHFNLDLFSSLTDYKSIPKR